MDGLALDCLGREDRQGTADGSTSARGERSGRTPDALLLGLGIALIVLVILACVTVFPEALLKRDLHDRQRAQRGSAAPGQERYPCDASARPRRRLLHRDRLLRLAAAARQPGGARDERE